MDHVQGVMIIKPQRAGSMISLGAPISVPKTKS
jgi:hypothetical protein